MSKLSPKIIEEELLKNHNHSWYKELYDGCMEVLESTIETEKEDPNIIECGRFFESIIFKKCPIFFA